MCSAPRHEARLADRRHAGQPDATNRDTLKHADIVLATVRPSSKDLEPQDLIAKAAKQERTLYIVNCAGKTDKLTKDAAAFAEQSALPPVLISSRADYVRADIAGKTAAELRKDASKEIASHGKP